MFTGIITDVGTIRDIRRNGDTRFEMATVYDTAGIGIGASISCSGACLTVIETGPGWFAVEVSGETLARTTLGAWKAGDPVNLERALKAGDELGGHVVSGHIDGVAEVVTVTPEGGSLRFVFEVPADLEPFIAPKGSLTVDGISFTVNEVDGRRFGINIIPHTQQVTTMGARQAGDAVNVEIDMLARYVARLLAKE
jgi:riboflavin synthase